MGSRSGTSRATLPSEAEVTPDLILAVPELAGYNGALMAFDSKQQDGYHWFLMPGQLALGEDDDPLLVVLSEANVSLLLFKNERDVPFGLPFVSSALTRTRGAAALERSALLSEFDLSDGDDATTGGDKLGGIHVETPSSTARAGAAPGSTTRPKAPLNLFGQPAPKPATPAQAAGTLTMAAHLTRGLGAAATTAGGGTGAKDLDLAPVARLATPLARAQCGVLTGGLLPGQPLLQSSEQGDLPSCFPPSLSPTMTGLLVGGGKGAPAEGSLRAWQAAQTVSSDEIERLAAGAIAGLGAGKGDVQQPAGFDAEARRPRECILFGLNDQELQMAVPKIIKMIGAHMNVSFPELSVVDMGSFLYLQALLDQLDQLVVLGASHVDCSLAVLMEHTYKSVSGIGVAATFKRVRYFMATLSKAYAECNGVGGLSTSAGGSVRYGGPGANPNGMAPKVCCGGPGVKGPCAHGKKDFAFLAAGHGCSGGDDGPSSGFNFNFNPKGLQQRGGGDGLGGGHASRSGEGMNSRCFVAADGGDDEVAIAGKTAASTMQADAFLQSAYNVSEDEQMRFELRELKNTRRGEPALVPHKEDSSVRRVCNVVARPDEHPDKRQHRHA